MTYFHTDDVVFHMKTTLDIDDSVMARLRREAARSGRTMSELVEAGLRLLLQSGAPGPAAKLPPLPKLNLGPATVDVADRGALYHVMEAR